MAKFNDMQAVLDFVVPKLVKQGHRSVTPGTDNCQYNGPNGTHCAIGWCANFSTTGGISTLYTYEFTLMEVTFGDIDPDFLRELQDAHDNAASDFVVQFLSGIASICVHYGLTFDQRWRA